MQTKQPDKAEKRLKKFMIETRLLYAVVIGFAVVLGALYDDVKNINRGRAKDNATTIRTICERQEFVLEKIVDTKVRIGHTNTDVARNAKTLKKLIQEVRADPENRIPLTQAISRIEVTLTNLRHNNDILRRGRAALELELARVNCDKLPAVNPFGGDPAKENTDKIKRREGNKEPTTVRRRRR